MNLKKCIAFALDIALRMCPIIQFIHPFCIPLILRRVTGNLEPIPEGSLDKTKTYVIGEETEGHEET